MSYAQNPNHHRNSKRSQNLQRAYGLTWAEYKRMFNAQAGRCGICRRTLTGNVLDDEEKLTLHVDHDHKTGAVRGLLCHKCNTALGLFGDNPTNLKRAVRYLRQGGAGAAPKAAREKARTKQKEFNRSRKIDRLVAAQQADENDRRLRFEYAISK